MKQLLLLIFTIPFFVFSQKTLRDSINIKTDLFEIVYSEKLQQPKYIKYIVQCPNGTASRKGMDFYVCDSIITSDNKDYENNQYGSLLAHLLMIRNRLQRKMSTLQSMLAATKHGSHSEKFTF